MIFVVFSIIFALNSGDIFTGAKNNIKQSVVMLDDIISNKSGSITEIAVPEGQIEPNSANDFLHSTPSYSKFKLPSGIYVTCKNPDGKLKNIVIDGQSNLEKMIITITDLRAQILEGREKKYDMSNIITSYNLDVVTYQKKYSEIENLRVVYNKQAEDYNACIEPVNAR